MRIYETFLVCRSQVLFCIARISRVCYVFNYKMQCALYGHGSNMDLIHNSCNQVIQCWNEKRRRTCITFGCDLVRYDFVAFLKLVADTAIYSLFREMFLHLECLLSAGDISNFQSQDVLRFLQTKLAGGISHFRVLQLL